MYVPLPIRFIRNRHINNFVIFRLITLTFHHCAKAIYRKHRLPLALHMALSLNRVSDVERNLLLDSGAINNDNSVFELPEWIPDERREAVQALGSSLSNVRKPNITFAINGFLIILILEKVGIFLMFDIILFY